MLFHIYRNICMLRLEFAAPLLATSMQTYAECFFFTNKYLRDYFHIRSAFAKLIIFLYFLCIHRSIDATYVSSMRLQKYITFNTITIP